MRDINPKIKIILGVLILLLSATILPLVSGNVIQENRNISMCSTGNTLYVGGGGPGNYSIIQNAINDANTGDTVFVYDDSSPYYENIVIHTSINLTGEDKDTTIIDGSGTGDVILITADLVVIEEFTIQNCGPNWAHPTIDSGIEIQSNYNTIVRTILFSCTTGIYHVSSTENNTLLGNTIDGDGLALYGIKIYQSNYNAIVDNTIINCGIGINLDYSNINFFLENSISDNFEGVFLDESHGNDFIYGTISSSLQTGIMLRESHENTIFDMDIESNDWHGISFYDSNNNEIIANDIYSNGNTAPGEYGGISINGGQNNYISANSIEENTEYGIYAYESGSNTIKNNTIIQNDRGIRLAWCYDNTIYNNYFNNSDWNAFDNGENKWNISKTPGRNILKDDGGGYLGGNYWHDDTSSDSDFDGLGNIGVPYDSGGLITTGGDYLPLKRKVIINWDWPIAKALIFWDLFSLPLPILKQTVILGPISVQIQPINNTHKINQVVFLLDGEQMHVCDQPPFVWKWDQISFGKHVIKVNIWDVMGNAGTSQMKVLKFF